MTKVRITYEHPAKEGVQLEVVGEVYDTSEDTTFVKRVDGYSIDVPTANIIKTEELAKQ